MLPLCRLRPTARALTLTLAALPLVACARAAAQCQPDQVQLGATDGELDDDFGTTIAVDGQWVLVGARRDEALGVESGSVYAFRVFQGLWGKEQRLNPADGGPGDWFGYAVAMSGSVAIVGAPRDGDVAEDAGAAYVFRFDGQGWVEEQKLTPAVLNIGDHFGTSVSVSGEVAAVGATKDDVVGEDAGAVYIFRFNGLQWLQEEKLAPSDLDPEDRFGAAVDLDSGLLAVGADKRDAACVADPGCNSGSVFVFRNDPEGWPPEAELVADDQAAGDHFGHAVNIADGRVVVGAPFDDTAGGADAGSTYVFRRERSAWVQEARLEASDAAEGDRLGYAVSVRDNVLLTGAPRADGAEADAGAAYAYLFDGLAWLEIVKLGPEGTLFIDHFGEAVAAHRGLAVIGAPFADPGGAFYAVTGLSDCDADGQLDHCAIAAGSTRDDNDNGFPDVCEQPTGACQIHLHTKIEATDAESQEQFGQDIDAHDGVVLVGAWRDGELGPDAGAAYVFRAAGDVWTQEAKLSAEDAAAQDRFGNVVSLGPDLAVIGAPRDDEVFDSSGSAYVFRCDGRAWSQEARLNPQDPAESQFFGSATALYGGVVAIGAPKDDQAGEDAGAAYVFRHSGGQWAEEAKLSGSRVSAEDGFGSALALHGDVLVVGAFKDDAACPQEPGCNSGSATVFRHDGAAWLEEATLAPSDGGLQDHFAGDLAIEDQVIVVGAAFDDHHGLLDAGSAYVFRYDGAQWVQEAKLTATDAAARDQFGTSVDISGGVIMVGAPRDGVIADLLGAAYVFVHDGAGWSEQARLGAADAAFGDLFATSVALADGLAAIGAPLEDGSTCPPLLGCNEGAAYVFAGISDCNDNGLLDHCEVTVGGVAGDPTTFLPLECVAGCVDHRACADTDGDGIRDDGCRWWACDRGVCQATDVAFADMGGFVGGCAPDGAADLNDRFHALNCFANLDVAGRAPYPCEPAAPAAFNVDSGGPFGDWAPDGVCDGHDAFHAINAFNGQSPCSCPADAPAPGRGGRPRDGDAPDLEPPVAGRASLRLQALQRVAAPGDVVHVEVSLDSGLDDLRGYQLHAATRGGSRGRLELIDIVMAPRADHVFAGLAFWQAHNIHTALLVAGLDTPGIRAAPGAHLATLVYRASPDALGTFAVDVPGDHRDDGRRTFLFITPARGGVLIEKTRPAAITVVE